MEKETKTPPPKKIFFFTSSEHGQCQVVLAVAHELLLLQKYEIHIMSFGPLAKRIVELNDAVTTILSKGPTSSDSPLSQATFHTIPGLASLDALSKKSPEIGPHGPGISGAIFLYTVIVPAVFKTWNGPEYMAGYDACLATLKSVNPDLIVAEPLICQGLEACKFLGRGYVVLSPNTFKDVLKKDQSLWARLTKIPALGSGWPQPLPRYLILFNIYLKFRLYLALIILRLSKDVRTFLNYRHSHGLPGEFSVAVFTPQQQYLVPSTPETDFPCRLRPNVTGCGPIMLPVAAVAETDAKMNAWLAQAPTVLVNLGSHIRMDDDMAREFAGALKVLLDRRPDVQILWKLKTAGGLGVKPDITVEEKVIMGAYGRLAAGTLDIIRTDIKNGRVRIEEWLTVDPLAIMLSGHVVCSIHHGGSNSFHEAVSAGIPQVVLPCWLDTYDFANRVEYLGIGTYGSREAAPRVETVELTHAIMRVMDDGPEARSMREKSKALAETVNKVGGRIKARDRVIEILETLEVKDGE